MFLLYSGMNSNKADKVVEYFSKYSPISDELNAFVRRHFELLLKWQNISNLIGITDEKEIAELLYLDSFIVLKCVSEFLKSENICISNIADIGSGAGFPSIFWFYFLPEAIVTFYEPKRKKANFLREFIRISGLKNYKVEEKMVQRKSLLTQLIISKAAININDWPRFAISNLLRGGVAVSLLSPNSEKIYSNALAKVGKIAKSVVIGYNLPYSQKNRFVGIIVKR